MEETQTDKIVALVSIYRKRKIDDDDDLRDRNKSIDTIDRLCHGIIVSHGGTVTPVPASLGIGDAFKLDVPVEEIPILRNIVDQAHDDHDLKVCMGVGHDIVEAKYAVENAIKDGPGTIRIYHPDMEEHSDEDSSNYDHCKDKKINKSEDDRDQAMQLLDKIKSSLPIFEQMKTQAPELYQQSLEMMQSMIQAVAAKKGINLDVDKDQLDAKAIQGMTDHLQNQYDQADNDEAAGEVEDQQAQQQDQPPVPVADGPDVLRARLPQDLLNEIMSGKSEKQDEHPDFSDSDDPKFAQELHNLLTEKQ